MNIPKMLKGNSVNGQIVVAFFTLTLLIIVVEVVAHSWLAQMLEISSLRERFVRLQEKQTKMKSVADEFILREKANEKFFETGQSIFLNKYAVHVSTLQQTISEIRQHGRKLGIVDEAELQQLLISVDGYNEVFLQMVEQIKKRGYGRFGLIGEFGKAIHTLSKFDFGNDKMALINLQLFVKDYLLTGDNQLAGNISNEVFNFTMVLENHVKDHQVPRLSTILYNYEKVFKQLVEVDHTLGIYTREGLQSTLFRASDELENAVKLVKTSAAIDEAYSRMLRQIYLSFFLIVIATIGAAVVIKRKLYKNLSMPIEAMKSIIARMSEGEVPNHSVKFKLEDFNAIALALNNLVNGTRNYQEFANNIGSGNLETSFALLSDKDILGMSLLAMRDNLRANISEQARQMQELKRLNTELDNFTYHASHDLRAPLSTIEGLVNLSLNESSYEVVKTYLQMIQGRVLHMDGLLKDLISLSYNNKTANNYQPVDFEDEVRSLLKSMISIDRQFDVTVDVRQNCSFVSDPVRLRTILGNLLSNSFKYFNPDAVVNEIDVRITVDEHRAFIEVSDNGIGIEEPFQEKIFEMFFRATTRSTGTGLGLYIVKSMVDRLKGDVQLESKSNSGTKFRLVIPNQARQDSLLLHADVAAESAD
jgi:signal transduction histidine kinase